MRTPRLICILTLLLSAAAPSWAGYDNSEPAYCGGCHLPFAKHMPFVAAKWKESRHARTYGRRYGNTFCAQCHAPLQADPDASYMNNDPVALEDWQSVTCSSCHDPSKDRVSTIAVYDIATGEHIPIADEDANQLCTDCHSGERHEVEFADFARKCVKKGGTRCVDCHMAKIPVDPDDPDGDRRAAHDFRVAGNLPYSCGVEGTGCHSGKPLEWALGKIGRWKFHGKHNSLISSPDAKEDDR